ncbi:hypothetical protein [Streptomyces sp. SHP 1-2]|uniref:hypothetical protein n=1 Tax=Streptomyces sp. SHP 1-2 TaxID=2769489 RepID=UPI0022374873|nr:hypothetical protein [Streptomyces sp. SHP 1-2]MCW5250442.1 hypothetical protein [Streptomyces sp. SHP 1-2]
MRAGARVVPVSAEWNVTALHDMRPEAPARTTVPGALPHVLHGALPDEVGAPLRLAVPTVVPAGAGSRRANRVALPAGPRGSASSMEVP